MATEESTEIELKLTQEDKIAALTKEVEELKKGMGMLAKNMAIQDNTQEKVNGVLESILQWIREHEEQKKLLVERNELKVLVQ